MSGELPSPPIEGPRILPFIVARRRPRSTRVVMLLLWLEEMCPSPYCGMASGMALVLVVTFGQEKDARSL